MKKFYYFATAIILSVMLAACGQSNETGGKTDNGNSNSGSQTTENQNNENGKEDDGKDNEKAGDESVSAEQLFDKLLAAQDDLKSFTADISMDQDMVYGEENMKTSTNILMDYVSDKEFSQKLSTNTAGQNIEMQMYFVEDGLFIYQEGQDQWMKAPKDMVDQLMQLDESQTDPYAQINQLKDLSDHFEVTEEGDTYVLTIKAGGEEFNEFIKETALEQFAGDEANAEQLLEGMKINSTDYHFVIDKETYFPVTMKIDMDMTMTQGEDTVDMKQNINMTYSNYNKIDKIELPEGVAEEAVEVEM